MKLFYVPFHLYAFTKETIYKFANEAGFKIEKIKSITPDNFFIVSLKSFLWRKKLNDIKLADREKKFNSIIFRMCASFILRLLDTFRDGDCLKVELIKEK